MKTLRVMLLASLVVSCHLDRLNNPSGPALERARGTIGVA